MTHQLKTYPLGRRTRTVLHRLFPNCFLPGPQKRPLKIGIHNDLLVHPHFASKPKKFKYAIRAALHDYCDTDSYRTCRIDGATRIDLNGEPTGIV